MIVTLYRNCILNNKYLEHFANNQILEKYLETLTKINITLEDVYQTKYGSITIDADQNPINNIYEFNYMKINQKDLKYYFIKSIILVNGYYKIIYEEDTFGTFEDKINFRQCQLERSKILNFHEKNISPYSIPSVYLGNNSPEINSILPNNIATQEVYHMKAWGYPGNKTKTDKLFYCLAKIQLYKLGQSDKITERQQFVVLLSNVPREYTTYDEQGNPTVHDKDINYYYNYNELKDFQKSLLIDNINYMIQSIITYRSSSDEAFKIKVFKNNYEYEIENFYLIPSSFDITNIFQEKPTCAVTIEMSNVYCGIHMIKNQFPGFSIGYHPEFFDLTAGFNDNIPINIASINLENNFKRLSIGTYTSQYEINNNGTSCLVEIYVMKNIYDFDLYLHFQNKIIKITEDFIHEIPFNSMNSEDFQLRKLNKTLQNVNGVATIGSGVVDMGLELSSINGIGNSKTTTDKVVRRKNKKTGRYNIFSKTHIEKTNISPMEDISEMIGESSKILSGITTLIEANSPFYSSMYGTFNSTPNGGINASFSICEFVINSDNDNFIKQLINETGYNVYEMNFDALHATPSNNENYNVIKYNFANIYGAFDQETREILETILENGIKIWYNINGIV